MRQKSYYIANCIQRICWALSDIPYRQHRAAYVEIAKAVCVEDEKEAHAMLQVTLARVERQSKAIKQNKANN